MFNNFDFVKYMPTIFLVIGIAVGFILAYRKMGVATKKVADGLNAIKPVVMAVANATKNNVDDNVALIGYAAIDGVLFAEQLFKKDNKMTNVQKFNAAKDAVIKKLEVAGVDTSFIKKNDSYIEQTIEVAVHLYNLNRKKKES